MTNEELAALIQAGDRDKLVELWEKVRRFVAAQARRRLVLSGGAGGVEFGDLYNAGYLALISAVNSFDPSAGRSFVSWLSLSLRTAFAEAGGYRSRKQARDPLHWASSTDALAYDEDSDTTVGDLVPDPAAAQAFEDVGRRIYQKQLRAVLKTAIDTLPDELRAEIISRYWFDRPRDSKVHAAALRQLRHPDRSRALRVFRDIV